MKKSKIDRHISSLNESLDINEPSENDSHFSRSHNSRTPEEFEENLRVYSNDHMHRPTLWLDPNEFPPGYWLRWGRMQLGGQSDTACLEQHIRNGWEPVTPEEYSYYSKTAGIFRSLGMNLEGSVNTVVVGGQMLLKKRLDLYLKEIKEDRRQRQIRQSYVRKNSSVVNNNLGVFARDFSRTSRISAPIYGE